MADSREGLPRARPERLTKLWRVDLGEPQLDLAAIDQHGKRVAVVNRDYAPDNLTGDAWESG